MLNGILIRIYRLDQNKIDSIIQYKGSCNSLATGNYLSIKFSGKTALATRKAFPPIIF